MEEIASWADLVDDITGYLLDSYDPEPLMQLYESMFPNTKVVYEGDSIFTVRSKP